MSLPYLPFPPARHDPRLSVPSVRAVCPRVAKVSATAPFVSFLSCFPVPISVKNFEKSKQTLLVLSLMFSEHSYFFTG